MKIMCSHQSSSSTTQTLEELDFDRGLWSAACDGDLKRCKELLQRGHDPSKPDKSGYTPLHYAVRSGSEELVECLLKGGANINAQTRGGKSTALHRACNRGRPEIVQLLIKYGCDLNVKDEDGKTALQVCLVDTTTKKEYCANLLRKIHGGSR